MKCFICGNNVEEVYEAFYGKGVIEACKSCILIEGLSQIQKPTPMQIDKSNQRATVYERMMKLSGLDKLNPISKDQEIAQRHLAKIRVPQKKQFSDLLIPNYDWTMLMARRRKKITTSQLSELTGIPSGEIESMEKGLLPKDFVKNARIIEEILGILILKESEVKRKDLFKEEAKTEEEILEEMRKKLFGEEIESNNRNKLLREEIKEKELLEETKRIAEEEIKKEEIKKEFREGKFDFSDKNKLKNVTLNDLIDMKREREKLEKGKKD